MHRKLILVFWPFLAIFPLTMSAYEKAFPPTPVGEIEVKTIPAARLIKASGDKDYFEGGNDLFRPLFRYISRNDIKMTVPVEAAIEPGTMYFYLGSDVADREFRDNETVKVIAIPERTVVSIGQRGGYSEKNFEKGKTRLAAWLEEHPQWRATGEARAVYWNGPFTPFFLKRAEVHIAVEAVE